MIISIIIPVYNAESRLKNTLDSILNQNTANIEIILVNDGSTDNSKNICDFYKNEHKNIKVIHQNNFGPSVARNRGIQESVGQYITFVDADDQLESNWFRVISETIANYSPELIITGFKSSVNEKGVLKFKRSISPKNRIVKGKVESLKVIKELISDSVFNPLWNKIYLAKKIEENKVTLNQKYRMGEDFLFNLDFFNFVENIVILSEETYNYILSIDGLTRSYIPSKFEKLLGVTLEFKKFLIKHDMSLSAYYQRLLRNVYSSTMEMFHKDCSLTINEKLINTRQILSSPNVQELLHGFKPEGLKQKFLVIILKSKSPKIILIFSKLFHNLKFKRK